MTSNTPFNIVIVYENIEAGIRARETAERITSELDGEMDINSNIWNYELLRQRQLRAQAAADASVADMIVISVSNPEQLPAFVQAWVDEWMFDRAGGAAALVLILNGNAARRGERSTVVQHLRTVARRSQMAFFCNTDYRPARTPTHRRVTVQARAAAPVQQMSAVA
jgi:hypothetical protein